MSTTSTLPPSGGSCSTGSPPPSNPASAPNWVMSCWSPCWNGVLCPKATRSSGRRLYSAASLRKRPLDYSSPRLVARMEGLAEEAEGCLRELLADADVADIVAGTLPDASPAAATAALKFTVGLLSCVPEQIFVWRCRPPRPTAGGCVPALAQSHRRLGCQCADRGRRRGLRRV